VNWHPRPVYPGVDQGRLNDFVNPALNCTRTELN
jgi:hypothetical protein